MKPQDADKLAETREERERQAQLMAQAEAGAGAAKDLAQAAQAAGMTGQGAVQ